MIKINPFQLVILSAIIVLLLLVWGKSCKISSLEDKLAKCQNKDKPIPTVDTFYVIVPEQVPISETLSQTHQAKPSKPRIDSFIQYERVVDTTDLAKLKEAYYELAEAYNLKTEYVDTSLFKNGIAVTNTTVYQNRVEEQKTILDSIRQEIVYNTVYKPFKQKDRTQLYLGIDAIGTKGELINAAGFTALIKLKSNIGFEGGTYFNSQNQQFYKAGVKFLIRLKKP